MEIEAWESSSDGTVDSEVDFETNDDEPRSMSGSIPKFQFRKDTSKACWDIAIGMAEVIEKKGGMWTTTGIIRRSKLYCTIEETLYFVERGALILLDGNSMVLPLKDIYGMVADGNNGCCWESFEAYRHLKSLGYIVRRHGIPWTVKEGQSSCNFTSLDGMHDRNGASDRQSEEEIPISYLLQDMQINEVRPAFDVYLPNSKFKKSSPGDPSFVLFFSRGYPPSNLEIENLERRCNGIPIKFCHVEHGRVSFFSFNSIEIPKLP